MQKFSTSTWHRKGSVGVIGEDSEDDDDDDNDNGEEEGTGAWTFLEIHRKLLKAFGSESKMIRFAF